MAALTLMGSIEIRGKARRAWQAPRAMPGQSERRGTEMSEKPIVTLFMLASVALPVAVWLVSDGSRAWPSPAAPCARSRLTV